jgi:predicted transcriptional regulator YheO
MIKRYISKIKIHKTIQSYIGYDKLYINMRKKQLVKTLYGKGMFSKIAARVLKNKKYKLLLYLTFIIGFIYYVYAF